MNQPTDLAAVRAAAERLPQWGSVDDLSSMALEDVTTLIDYALATIPADATAARCLREQEQPCQ